MNRSKLDIIFKNNNKNIASFLKEAKIMFSSMDLESILEELNKFKGEIYPFWVDRPKYKYLGEFTVRIDDGEFSEGNYEIVALGEDPLKWVMNELELGIIPSSW